MTLLHHNLHQSERGQKSMFRLVMQYHKKIWLAELSDNKGKAIILLANIPIQTLLWLIAMSMSEYMPIVALAANGALLSIMAVYRFPYQIAPLDLQHLIAFPCRTTDKWKAFAVTETIATFSILVPIFILQLAFAKSSFCMTIANMVLLYVIFASVFVNGRFMWTRHKIKSHVTTFVATIGMSSIVLCINYHEKSARGAILYKLNTLYLEHELSVFIALSVIAVAAAIASAKAFRHICTTYPFRKPELLQRLKRKP